MKGRFALNPHVLAIIENEWAQMIRNKVVIFTTLVPPFLLVLLAMLALVLSSFLDLGVGEATGIIATLTSQLGSSAALSNADMLRAALLSPFLVLFQMIPLVVPVTIASYSIVGEKQTRSLEALLSTPVRTWELLLAKALSAALPGVIATWFGFGIFALAARFVVSNVLYKSLLFSPSWVLSIVLMTPLLTLLAVSLAIIISSRVRDPQSAQQLGSLLILPLLGVLVAQMSGLVALSPGAILGAAAGMAFLDAFLIFAAVRIFGREEILTTWR